MSTDGDGAPDAAAAIEALRARGAPRLAPVRWRLLQALARRAAASQGPTRQRLHDRLARLLAACAQDLDRPGVAAAEAVPPPPRDDTLGSLLAYIASQTPDPVAPRPAGPGLGDGRPAAELKAVRDHRGTWSRLSADRRLMQALAQVPGQAGPLNTQRLLHQALTVMRDAAPGYLHHFLSHAEALLWLDQARLAPAASTAPEPRRRRHARPARPR